MIYEQVSEPQPRIHLPSVQIRTEVDLVQEQQVAEDFSVVATRLPLDHRAALGRLGKRNLIAK